MKWGVEGRCVREGESAWLASPLCSVLSAAMSEQEVPSSVTQHIIINFLTNEGVKPSEILTRLKVQSQNRVFTLARQFKDGRESVENKSHDRRPRSSLSNDYIHAIRELIKGVRRLTVDEMHWEILDHPPYSPDLSLCDYFFCAHERISWRGSIRKQ